MKKYRGWMLFAFLMFFTLASANAGVAAPSREDTLIVATWGDVNALDPIVTGARLSANLFWQVYDPLVAQNPDGSLTPRLAESWEQPDDTNFTMANRLPPMTRCLRSTADARR